MCAVVLGTVTWDDASLGNPTSRRHRSDVYPLNHNHVPLDLQLLFRSCDHRSFLWAPLYQDPNYLGSILGP